MTDKYAHIIDLPHHVSKVRPQMTMYQRAAQFAPFAALTGQASINIPVPGKESVLQFISLLGKLL